MKENKVILKEMLEKIVLKCIYERCPHTAGQTYINVGKEIIMNDCAPLELDKIKVYPYKFVHSGDSSSTDFFDSVWMSGFAEYVSKWFWKDVNESFPVINFFVATVVIDDDFTVGIYFGIR